MRASFGAILAERHLVIMVKEPHPGRVKTRLGRDLGMVPAAWWFRHQTAALVRRLSRDPRWKTVLGVSPDREGATSRIWPKNLPRWAQGRGDLGHRMGRIFRKFPPGPVVIIGADIPGITAGHIARAFKALGDHDAVLGPAPDGGYWLIGLKRGRAVPKTLFADVRWSSPTTMADTLRGLSLGRVALIDTLHDIDTAQDLKHAGEHFT